jgi:hypothetical protein
MRDIDMLWTVQFCPQTNQFDIESVYDHIRGNLDMLQNHRVDCDQNERWMLIYISKTQEDCQGFIDFIKPKIKTGNSPIENWSFEDYFDESKN